MFSAFRFRRPWAAATIAFVFGPFLGMLYLNRGYLALIYLGLEVVSIAVGVAMFPFLSEHFVDTTLALLISPIQLFGAVHAYVLARKSPVGAPIHWYSRWYALVLILLAFPVSALATRAFLFQSFDIPSQSMSPTLNAGDYFFVTKFAYINSPPQRGDLIVFKALRESRTVSFVKRIAGVPGDRIDLVDGKVYVNGVSARIERAPELWSDCKSGQCTGVPEYFEWLPGGSRHRILQASTDGQLDNIPAVAVPPGSYYVLGDNRDNSDDSRLDLGLVRAGNIVGRVVVKFIDGRQHRVVWQSVN